MLRSLFARKHFRRPGQEIEERSKLYVGLLVICEDNVLRRIINVVAGPAHPPAAKQGLILINEGDPEMPCGHWVTLLACECALKKMPPPDRKSRLEWRELATRVRSVNLKSIYDAHRRGKMPLDFND